MSFMVHKDLVTGEVTRVTVTDPTETVRNSEPLPSWMLPPQPTTVHIRLRRQGKGTTAEELEHRDLPVELAETFGRSGSGRSSAGSTTGSLTLLLRLPLGPLTGQPVPLVTWVSAGLTERRWAPFCAGHGTWPG